MEILALTTITVLYIFCCIVSYTDDWRNSYWYIPVITVVGLLINMIWAGVVKYLDDKQQIYIFGLVWDSIMMTTYYLLPILFFNVKLTKQTIFGLLFVVAGVIVLKFPSKF